MHILQKGCNGGQVDIISTPREEGNAITYRVNMVATNVCVGIPPRVPDYSTSDIYIATWNCRGIARASFTSNLRGLLAVTGVCASARVWAGVYRVKHCMHAGYVPPGGGI